jgi:23S rRNA (cytosine1962-C5)-methyltransferase
MFATDQYRLLDFGDGRKLERFGQVILDRPAPAAHGASRSNPEFWKQTNAKFELSADAASTAQRGQWIEQNDLPKTWSIAHDALQFELKRTDFGHVGLFPEQASNWDWFRGRVSNTLTEPPRVLNLFAYTGGSTLAAAAAGAAVTHVDAARNVVAWARRNADLSGLAPAPIRWIAEDAMKFVRREIKRGQSYDAIVLDPPGYGHGPAGEAWMLDKHLPELLSVCRELTQPQPRFILLTCHAPEYDPARLAEMLVAAGFADRAAQVEADDMWLVAADGRRLHAGCMARFAI